MAWNGSDNEKVEARGEGGHRKGKHRSSASTTNFNCKTFIAGLVVVIGGGLLAWLFIGGEKDEDGERVDVKPSQIAEVKPQVVTNSVVVADVDPEANKWKYADGRKLPADAYKDERGIWRHPGGQRVFNENAPVTRLGDRQKHLFKYKSENMIGGLISAKPGSMMMGSVKYNNKAFLQDFLESCKEPIEILDTDTESEKALKQEVESVKQDLLERFRNGEDIGKLLSDERKELQKLGQLKQSLRAEVQKAMHDGSMSDEDAADVIRAANKMLEERGSSPISINPIAVSNMRMHLRQSGKMTRETDNKTEEK